MITAQDIRGMYAIIPTPAKVGSDKLEAVDTVDLIETERVIDALISDGSTGLIVLGTTGECATLAEPDYNAFVSCVLEVTKRRVPVFVGTSALGGHEVARRLRFIRELHADGSLLGLPMWQPVTTSSAVSFYRSVSEAFPNVAIMVYANARAFRYAFPHEFWATISKEAPTATSAKYSRVQGLANLISATEGRINFVPNEMAVHQFYDISPETTTACWATASGMNPTPVVALMQAIEARNTVAVSTLASAIAWANEPILSLVDNPELFAQYNIQLEKTRINAAGYMNCGPIRPPYQEFPEVHALAAKECGLRWSRICKAYRGNFAFDAGPWCESATQAA